MNDTKKISLSNVFEWFDFTVFSFLSVPIGLYFFDSEVPGLAVLYTFSVFAVSYLVRPLGSLFFSYIADKSHAFIALRYTMLAMAIPTALIGFLPGYQTIGIAAPILLVVLRCIQGFAAGGELPSLASFIFEATPEGKYKNVWCAVTNIGGMIGFLLASFSVFLLYYFFSSDDVNNWAWRIPFILSIPFSIYILSIRWKVTFVNSKPIENSQNGTVLSSVVKMSTVMAFLQVSFYMIFVWLPNYLENHLMLPSHFVKPLNVISLIALLIATIISAFLGTGGRSNKLVFLSALGCAVASIPLFFLINTKSYLLVYTAIFIFVFLLGMIQGNYMFMLTNEFKGKGKNKLISLTYTIPTALLGGTVGMICSYFVFVLNLTYFPAFYLLFFSTALCVVFVYFGLYKKDHV